MGTILRLSRNVIRFVSHCGPLTRCLTKQNVLIANRSRLNRNNSVHAGTSCNCFTRPSNGHTILTSLRTVAIHAGRLCPKIPCFLLKRDVNSFCTQRCLYRCNRRLSKTVVVNANFRPGTLIRFTGALYQILTTFRN